jgi:hypothetical protein
MMNSVGFIHSHGIYFGMIFLDVATQMDESIWLDDVQGTSQFTTWDCVEEIT